MTTRQAMLHIFCGYAHEDQALFQQLNTALAVPIRQETISIWHYGDLLPGAHWEKEIERQLNTADIILLLITPAFMASDYCWSREMQWAITRSTTGAARVIPILGKPTPGWETTPLGKLQALPTGTSPITSWRNRDEALSDTVEGLIKVIHQMQQEDHYPVKEYVIGLQPSVYVSPQEDIPAQEVAKHLAEQWLKDISHVGTLQTLLADEHQNVWIIANHHQACHISMRWNYKGIDSNRLPFRSASILLTSQHPAFLDQLLEAGKLPYHMIQWTLQDDLNVPLLARQFFEQGERHHISATQVVNTDQVAQTHHVEYALGDTYLMFRLRTQHGW